MNTNEFTPIHGLDKPRAFSSDAEMKAFYDTNGYVSLRGLIPLKLLTDLQAALNHFYSKYSKDVTPGMTHFDSAVLHLDSTDRKALREIHAATSRVFPFQAISQVVSEVIPKLGSMDKPVAEIASGYILGIPKDNRLKYGYHQDSTYVTGFDHCYNVWYPIFREATPFHGTMSILPKTHTLGTLPFDVIKEQSDAYTTRIPKNIEDIKAQYEELYCDFELGDCIIFHNDLVHTSNYNYSDVCRVIGISKMSQDLKGDWGSGNVAT